MRPPVQPARAGQVAGAAPAGAAVTGDKALIVSAAGEPFAPNSYARARLLRQLFACGLLGAGAYHPHAGGTPR